ncbi:UDP binding domain-containing protein [Paraburkholderia nemoris]|uniref:UDP binding domain-containing protein n=1 Tax=Paraburkholderia nemoris TaxID=2793076 RepID=UPI0038B80CFC
MRDAPSRTVAYGLLKRGATVRAYDPVANKEARRAFNLDLQDEPDLGKRLSFADTQAEATEGADALVVITEWTVLKVRISMH